MKRDDEWIVSVTANQRGEVKVVVVDSENKETICYNAGEVTYIYPIENTKFNKSKKEKKELCFMKFPSYEIPNFVQFVKSTSLYSRLKNAYEVTDNEETKYLKLICQNFYDELLGLTISYFLGH